ncbi:hypothetical protein TYRP_013850 [Tyrophagus putrescentiae]|nr:hypothetical protein TYRP_013850 [Tyrophagus putrescentiae]
MSLQLQQTTTCRELDHTFSEKDVLALERGSSRVRAMQLSVPWSVTRSSSPMVSVPLGKTFWRWLYGRRTPSEQS